MPLESQEERKSSSEDFYLDQKYFSKKCGEEMIRRRTDRMLVKNIFFREDGVVESAYVNEEFSNWSSLNFFLQNHIIDELEENPANMRYPNEEL